MYVYIYIYNEGCLIASFPTKKQPEDWFETADMEEAVDSGMVPGWATSGVG